MMRRTTVMVELARLQGSQAALTDQLKVVTVDHETRMRRIERYMYGVPAALAVALASIVTTFVRH